MTRTRPLDGVFTALVTPFTRQGDIDWPAYDRLIDRQMEAGIAGLVPVGTTGEAATLTSGECRAVIERTVRRVQDCCYVLAGAGANATVTAVENAIAAQEAGADGVLLATPAYNKPSQRGLLEHFGTVAGRVAIDVVLYSVPGRAIITIEPETAAQLTREHRNVIGMKEAGGDPLRATRLHAACGKDFAVHAGDDSLALPFYALGACGLTSVASNLAPRECIALHEAWKRGDHEKALDLHRRMTPLVDALFLETSPAPIKLALSLMGLCEPCLRLPLVETSRRTASIVAAATQGLREGDGKMELEYR